ncbi:MAG: riboflavin kinase, partial [Phycisphaerales bacterium]
EAHIIRPPAERLDGAWRPLTGLAEYGWPIRLELFEYLRDQVRFAGLDALRAQLARDVDRAVRTVERAAVDTVPALRIDANGVVCA